MQKQGFIQLCTCIHSSSTLINHNSLFICRFHKEPLIPIISTHFNPPRSHHWKMKRSLFSCLFQYKLLNTFKPAAFLGNGEVTFDEHSSIIMTFLLRLLLLCPHHWLLITLLLPQKNKNSVTQASMQDQRKEPMAGKAQVTNTFMKPCYQLGNHWPFNWPIPKKKKRNQSCDTNQIMHSHYFT